MALVKKRGMGTSGKGVVRYRVIAGAALAVLLWLSGLGCFPPEAGLIDTGGASAAHPASSPSKEGIPATLSIGIANKADELAVGKTIRVTLRVTPDTAVARMSVRFTQTGGVKFESDAEKSLGAAGPGQMLETSVDARLAEPGKTELRGWVEACDAEGKQVFAGSRALYLVISHERVLVGNNGFMELELAELERQRQAGAISSQEYERRAERIRSGGATETIRMSTPEPTGNVHDGGIRK